MILGALRKSIMHSFWNIIVSCLYTNWLWNNHMQCIVHKAVRVNGFLYRNPKSCPSCAKLIWYKSLVRPTLEYASSFCDLYTNLNIQKLESVQKCAARFCLTPHIPVWLLCYSLFTYQAWRNVAKLIILYYI